MNNINATIYSYSFEFDDDIVYLCNHKLSKMATPTKKNLYNINSIIDNYEFVSIVISYDKSKLGANFESVLLHIDILYFDKIIIKLSSMSISIGKHKKLMYINDYASNLTFDVYTFSDFKIYLNKVISYKIELLKNEFKILDFIKFKNKFSDKKLKYYEFEEDNSLIKTIEYLKILSYNKFIKIQVPEFFINICETFLNNEKNTIMLKESSFEFRTNYGTFPCIQIKNPVFYIYQVTSKRKNDCIKFLYYILSINNNIEIFTDEFEKIMLNQK